MESFDYNQKKAREKAAWYKKNKGKTTFFGKILRHPLIFNSLRISFSYIFPKEQMAEVALSHRKEKVEKLLIAPCGTGDDLKYLNNFAEHIYGIDLSPIAVKQCSKIIEVKVGDILESGYPDKTFDIIVSPLFFHHFSKMGFAPFLKEFHRILKEKGGLVILEPSLWYPLNFITRPIKIIFNNPFGEVEDESPFRPGLMLNSLKMAGFVNIKMRAASFSHCSFYIPLAKLVNWLTRPLLNVWPFKYFGWMIVYWAEKNE